MEFTSVRDFVEDALYHPETGYYTAHIGTVGGRRGDFATSTTLSGHLAQAVARWLLSTGHAHVIEVGAGDGSLAEAVLAALPFWKRRRIRYHVVEISPILARQQKARRLLGRHGSWHPDIQAATAAARHRAAVVSNELIDAFPCHLLEWHGDEKGWCEILVAPGTTDERLVPFEGGDLPPAPPVPLQRIEHHLPYRDWLASWVPQMDQLAHLTIDYGDTYPALYDRRPGGSLRAYFHHQRLVGHEVFLRRGRQDITADVNFSALQTWGESLGLRTAELTTQREFIRAQLGITQEDVHRDLTLAYLLDPYGPGTAFKVLVQTT